MFLKLMLCLLTELKRLVAARFPAANIFCAVAKFGVWSPYVVRRLFSLVCSVVL